MSCNRPVADMDGLPGCSLPAKVNGSAGGVLCKSMHRESHVARLRPKTAASNKALDNTLNKVSQILSGHHCKP